MKTTRSRRDHRCGQASTAVLLTDSRLSVDDIARHGEAKNRRGAVMVFALVALLVTSMIIGSLLRTAGMAHRQLKRDEFRLQACLLAEAGCERGRALLVGQPDFTTGEWRIAAEELSNDRTAIVTMFVEKTSDGSSGQIIKATAVYPVDHPDLVRITRQIHVP